MSYIKCDGCRYRTQEWETAYKRNPLPKNPGRFTYVLKRICKACINGGEFSKERVKGRTTWVKYREPKRQGLQEITLADIKDMRRRGLTEEADQLLRAWRKNIEQNKKQINTEINRQDRQIKRALCKKEGLCYDCGIVESKLGRCFECVKKHRIYATREKIRKEKAREKNEQEKEEGKTATTKTAKRKRVGEGKNQTRT